MTRTGFAYANPVLVIYIKIFILSFACYHILHKIHYNR